MEENVQTHYPAELSPGEKPRHPLNRRLVGLQIRSGRFREEKINLTLPGFETRTVQPIA